MNLLNVDDQNIMNLGQALSTHEAPPLTIT